MHKFILYHMSTQLDSADVLIAISRRDYNSDSDNPAFDIYLINRSHVALSYKLSFSTQQRPESHQEGNLASGAVIKWCHFCFYELNHHPKIAAYISTPHKTVSQEWRLRPKSLIKTPVYISYLNNHGYLLARWSFDPMSSVEKKNDATPISAGLPVGKQEDHMSQKRTAVYAQALYWSGAKVIDLHIEAICADHHRLSPAEILHTQLAVLERCIESAIVADMPSIIVIHGVGTGKLRKKIIEYCRTHPCVKRWGEPLVNIYGAGATEIWFK